jgi:hypothetical protein
MQPFFNQVRQYISVKFAFKENFARTINVTFHYNVLHVHFMKRNGFMIFEFSNTVYIEN